MTTADPARPPGTPLAEPAAAQPAVGVPPAADSPAAITVHGLRMSYGSYEAVRGIDFEVGRGEILAFLGPNGAGKTTTVEICEGFRKRTAGEVRVLGDDPAHAGPGWRARVGVVLQESAPEALLTVRECLSEQTEPQVAVEESGISRLAHTVLAEELVEAERAIVGIGVVTVGRHHVIGEPRQA